MDNKEKNFLSAVIYVHNAEKQIGKFMKTVIQILESNFEKSEIICVNDCSDDNSVKEIKKISDSVDQTSISIINMSYFHGLELAMNAGVDLSIGDFIFEFDTTDLDFDPREIMNIYQKALEGYDIVSASPNKKQKFSSDLFYYLFDRFTNLSYKMNTETFRILSRRVVNRISDMNKSVLYRKAVYNNCGLKMINHRYEPIYNNMEKAIDSKERKYRSGLAIDSLILFTNVGYNFSIAMTLLMMSVTFLVAIYSLAVYITSNPVAGWTTTILFLSVAFFGVFGLCTIVIKYLQIIVDLIFRRKRYNFQSIEKLTK